MFCGEITGGSYENFLQVGSWRWTTSRASFIRGDSFDTHLGPQSMLAPKTTLPIQTCSPISFCALAPVPVTIVPVVWGRFLHRGSASYSQSALKGPHLAHSPCNAVVCEGGFSLQFRQHRLSCQAVYWNHYVATEDNIYCQGIWIWLSMWRRYNWQEREGVGRKCKVGPMVFWRPRPNWECHTYSSQLTLQHLCHSIQRVYSGSIASICDRKYFPLEHAVKRSVFVASGRLGRVSVVLMWGDVVHSCTIFLCCLDGEM